MSHPPTLPAPLYRGSVNTWECDEGGHLNVRFHFERAMIGLAYLAHALELPRAFAANATSTLAPLEAHVRFSKEARPGAPLTMHGGVTRLDQTEATLCLDMRHADGAAASCFTFRVAHVDTRSLRAFPWSQRTRAAAKRLACMSPTHAKPRSIDLARAPEAGSGEQALACGAVRIGASAVSPDQCDAFGRLRAEHFVGRASDSVPNLLAQWRREAAQAQDATPAGAVVEARVAFRRFPHPGDLIELYSGLTEVGEKTLRLTHWFVDPETDAPWASMEAVALTFDTKTRKSITPSPEQRARMEKLVIAMSI